MSDKKTKDDWISFPHSLKLIKNKTKNTCNLPDVSYHCYIKKNIIATFIEYVNHRRYMLPFTVILVVTHWISLSSIYDIEDKSNFYCQSVW